MNLPNSNIRGFFEMLMPGIFLVINAAITAYCLAAALAPNLRQTIDPALSYIGNPAVALLLLVVFGFLVGIVLRLLKTQNVDTLSAKYIRWLKPNLREALYLKENFFYNNWMMKKCESQLPFGAKRFYEEYWFDKGSSSPKENTIFFNFCKMIITKYDPQSASEIFGAEALNRFLAGSFYALEASIFLMSFNALVAYHLLYPMAAILPAVITLFYFLLLHVILSQFRYLRCKEVDTVFNACFANREHFQELLPTNENRHIMKDSQDTKYDMRRDLILQAWGERRTDGRPVQSLDLDKLTSLMKKKSKEHPYLSSLYFAGANVDHPYFLENIKLAVGIAVLPEDSEKAGLPKQHSHQTEIILVLQGKLCLHFEDGGKITEKNLNESEHFVIEMGTCHWVTSINNGDAVYLFIKSNPSEEPRSQPCSMDVIEPRNHETDLPNK